MQPSSIPPPTARWAPRCAQNASTMCGAPSSPRNSTTSSPNTSNVRISPGSRSRASATMNHPLGTGNGNRGAALGLRTIGRRLRSTRACGSRGIGKPVNVWWSCSLIDMVAPGLRRARALARCGRSVHLFGGRSDAIDQGSEGVEVDAVDLGRGEPEDPSRLVLGDVAEPLADPVAGVGERALGVRAGRCPTSGCRSRSGVAGRCRPRPGRRREEAVAIEVLARLHRQPVPGRRRRTCGCCARRPTSRPSCGSGPAPTRRRSRPSSTSGPGGARRCRPRSARPTVGPPTSRPRTRRSAACPGPARCRRVRRPSGCAARGRALR